MADGHKVMVIGGCKWAISVLGGGTGGFVALARLPEKPVQAGQKKTLDEQKAWWAEQLRARQIEARPADYSHLPYARQYREEVEPD